MGKIFYLMGKSSSGKDTIYKELLQGFPKMKRIVLYTTRPRREGECDGVEYFFTDEISISVGIGVVKGKKYLQVMYSDALRKKVKKLEEQLSIKK